MKPNADDKLHVNKKLDGSAEPVIIAGYTYTQLAADTPHSPNCDHAGCHFFLDVTTLFEVPRKSRGKTR